MATDNPATPWSGAALLPGSGVAQRGTTPSGQTLSGGEEQGSELLTFYLCSLLSAVSLGPREGSTTHDSISLNVVVKSVQRSSSREVRFKHHASEVSRKRVGMPT